MTVLIALPLGIYQASKRNTTVDYLATGTAFVLYGIPAFLLGSDAAVLQLWLASLAHLSPERCSTLGHVHQSRRLRAARADPYFLSIAFLSRFMRSAVLEVLVQDYVRTAIAKGCGKRRMLIHHAFRNALGPIVIILGLYFPGLLGGAVVIESRLQLQRAGDSGRERRHHLRRPDRPRHHAARGHFDPARQPDG